MKPITLEQIPSYARRSKIENLILDDAPLFIQCKGDRGEFHLGTESLGKAIDIQVLAWRWIQEARWSGGVQWWLDVIFATPNRMVCIAAFKKQGAINMAAKLKSLANQDDTAVALHSLWLQLGFLPQETGDGKTYYVPDILGHRWASEVDYEIAEVFLEDQSEFDRKHRSYLWAIPGES